jgi:multidrug efflux system membrane fusion protein
LLQEDLDQARTAEKAARAELDATLLQAKQASAAVTGVDAMVAQRAGILAQIALAELHLEFTEVRAPFNGVVVALKTVGQYASALKPVFTLMDDDRWYVIANFRETDLKNVRPGVAARVTIMTNHDKSFAGVVDSVGSGVLPEGGSVIEGLPIIQKSINWVHVSQRFPVKIAVKDPDPELFRMGASASAVLQPQ